MKTKFNFSFVNILVRDLCTCSFFFAFCVNPD